MWAARCGDHGALQEREAWRACMVVWESAAVAAERVLQQPWLGKSATSAGTPQPAKHVLPNQCPMPRPHKLAIRLAASTTVTQVSSVATSASGGPPSPAASANVSATWGREQGKEQDRQFLEWASIPVA